ncbi:MAG: hypothetical protein WBV55_11745 [Candidatus Sulfotelmatobacter sp.]
MRRLIAIAAFLFLAASLPLQAQRGGGHASAGGHGGFSGHASFGGGFAGGHSFGGMRGGSGFAAHSFSRGSSFRGPLASRGFNSNRFNRSRGFDRSRNRFRLRSYGFGNCYAYGCGYGWGYPYPYLYGGIDPYWWWDSDSSDDQDQQNQIGLANEMNQQSLEEQQMRNQADQDAYADARSAPRSPRQASTTESDPSTVLIFRDQHKEEIKNYAIVGQTLWNFSPQGTHKIPLSSLDLPATEKANDDRGVEFHLPGANEGQ